MRNEEQKTLEYRRRRQAKVGYLAMFHCRDCGTTEHLELDHRDDTVKLFNPADVSQRSWQSLWNEWAKCDVRCKACHARRHILKRHRGDGARRMAAAVGEAHGRTHLTRHDVRSIRRIYRRGGVTQQSLANRFRLTQSTVSKIVRAENLGVGMKHVRTTSSPARVYHRLSRCISWGRVLTEEQALATGLRPCKACRP